MQEQTHFRVTDRRRRRLRPEVEVSRHQSRCLGSRGCELGNVDIGLLKPPVERLHAEIDEVVLRDLAERLPGLADPVAIHRVIGLLRQTLCRYQDRTFRGDGPARAVQPAEALPQGIEGGSLRHQSVEIEVDANLQTLCSDQDEGSGLSTAGSVGAEGTESVYDSISGHISRASDHQQGFECAISPLAQLLEYRAGQSHPVDYDTNGRRRHAGTSQAFGHLPRGARKRIDRIAPNRLHQSGALGGLQASLQDRVGSITRPQREGALTGCARRGGQDDRLDPGSAEFVYIAQCLPEGLGKMGFVEQDETVLTEEAGVNRLHTIRHTVPTKQQSRTDLIDGGTEEGWLGWCACPVVLQRCAATKSGRYQRGRVCAGQELQPPSYLLDHGPSR